MLQEFILIRQPVFKFYLFLAQKCKKPFLFWLVGFLFINVFFLSPAYCQNEQQDYLKEGQDYYYNGEYKKALDTLSKAIKIDHKSKLAAKAYHFKAITYHQMGRYSTAASNYSKAFKIDPQLDYLFSGALAKYDAKRYSTVIKDLNKVIKQDPQYRKGEALYWLGMTYDKMRDYDRSIYEMTRAIKIDSKNAKFYHDRGTVYFNTKNYPEAVKDFEIALKFATDEKTKKLVIKNMNKLPERYRPTSDEIAGISKQGRSQHGEKENSSSHKNDELQLISDDEQITSLMDRWSNLFDSVNKLMKDPSQAELAKRLLEKAIPITEQILERTNELGIPSDFGQIVEKFTTAMMLYIKANEISIAVKDEIALTPKDIDVNEKIAKAKGWIQQFKEAKTSVNDAFIMFVEIEDLGIKNKDLGEAMNTKDMVKDLKNLMTSMRSKINENLDMMKKDLVKAQEGHSFSRSDPDSKSEIQSIEEDEKIGSFMEQLIKILSDIPSVIESELTQYPKIKKSLNELLGVSEKVRERLKNLGISEDLGLFWGKYAKAMLLCLEAIKHQKEMSSVSKDLGWQEKIDKGKIVISEAENIKSLYKGSLDLVVEAEEISLKKEYLREKMGAEELLEAPKVFLKEITSIWEQNLIVMKESLAGAQK